MLATYAANHDADVWADPEVFRPARRTLEEVLRAVIAARPALAGDVEGLAWVSATGANPAAIPVDFPA